MRLALRVARIGTWARDLLEQRVRWSAELEEVFGLPPGSFEGTEAAFLDRVHPEDRHLVTAAVSDSIASRADYAIEFRFRHASGEWRWMEGRGRAAYDAAGTAIRIDGIGMDITDRKREELTRASLAAIVQSSDDAIIGKDLQGIVTSWNAGAMRIFGYAPEEMIGQSIMTLIPPDLQHEEATILARIRKGERIEHYETLRNAKDGRQVPVSLTISPVLDLQGRVVGVSKISRDITNRRRNEAAMRDEAHAIETLNRVGTSLTAELDLDRVVQMVTDAARELSGAAFAAFFYNQNIDGQDEYWLYRISGMEREAFAAFPKPRATALLAPTFKGEGVIRSDDVLKDPRYGRNAPHSGMPHGHLPVRSYLAVPVMSRSAGVLGALLLGHPEPGVFTARGERLVIGIAAQAGTAIENARLYLAAQKNEEMMVQAAAEREQLLASERAARTEAEHLGHVKDEFLATLSHELRTPLNAIQGWAALLRQPTLADAERTRGIETIERNARSQAQIINDLLDMSRIVSGKVHLEVRPFSLQETIMAALDAVRPSADAKRIRLRTLLDTSIGMTRGDPNRIQQVLWNLLTNAVKFTPADGLVQVILERVNSHVEVVVQDSGIGITPDFLPHVFDRFRQADPGTTRRYGGLGLGLSIVRSLVELHGGSVRVKSPGENRGATFIVALPVSSLQPEDVARHQPKHSVSDSAEIPELPRLEGIRVLVVDDEADGRTLLSRILEERGATTHLAGSAKQALDVLGRETIDVMLSDIGMPETDGYTLMREVRARDATRAGPIPAIAVTAYARPEDRQRSLLAGYQMHIAKPVDARELIAGIASLLKISR